ncbi:MAG: hypothetical protein RQ728_04070 [Brevefilum sp.]|nr:hypothetical protein [Brevefilum sp.]MDT8381414.1 hypothetical protein [Brevefilum sp.]
MEAYATPFVKVQFTVSLPTPLSEGETVTIVILDEVTGLPYNRQTYEMKEVDSLSYTAALSIPMQSVVKYRYEKIGTENMLEISPNGRHVRYRMYYVEGNAEHSDEIFSWKNDKRDFEVGRFEGVVLDQNTGLPIPDILINVGGITRFTDTKGLFVFNNLPAGTHNTVFFAIDGKYRVHQQGAVIATGKTTPANIKLIPNTAVEVTFLVSPPDDALGAPVYIAGNLVQFGNTFSDLMGSMSIETSRMPLLEPQADGKLSKTMNLYTGTDLRFKFTLGDGYWNTEQKAEGGNFTRQLIVPDQNVTLELQIESWRSSVFEPISFSTFIHPSFGYAGERYIQFKVNDWTEPLRMWPIGNGNYLYILFSPFEMASPITYRVCLNTVCNSPKTNSLISKEEQVEPSDQPLTRSITVDSWLSELTQETFPDIYRIPFPYKSQDYKTIIELSPRIRPSESALISIAIEEISQMNANTVILTPQWFQNGAEDLLHPEIGKTPFYFELYNYINTIKENGFAVGIYPQMEILTAVDGLTFSGQNKSWRQSWFDSYRQFVLNYAKLAEITNAEYLLIGDKILLESLPDQNSYSADQVKDQWLNLISDIRSEYDGKLVWAANAGTEMDPLPEFIDSFDEIYVSMDSPLSDGTSASFDQIAYGFTRTLDNFLYEVYRSTLKPVTLAFAYPSIDGAVQGCQLLNNDCNNDGLFVEEEVSDQTLDLFEQAEIYNAIFPTAASREWITGISIRGYIPGGTSDDLTSSISGKPAKDVIQHWFSGLNQ